MLVYKADNLRIHRLVPFACNCYLIQTPAACVLVDTSIALERRMLRAQLRRLCPAGIDAVILTHVHIDHVGSAAALKEKYGCPVYAHAEGLEALAAGRCGIPGTPLVARFAPCEAADIAELPFREWFGPAAYLLETPGHTPDSVSIVLPGQLGKRGGAALVGDAVIGRAGKKQDWDKLLRTGCGTFLPGHGKPLSAAWLGKEAGLLVEVQGTELSM